MGSVDVTGEVRRFFTAAAHAVLVLDYDGTLVPIAATPELAVPDDELRELLTAMAASPRVQVHVVSGRARDVLDDWLGGFPITLWAEHGAFRRQPSEPDWETIAEIPAGWKHRVEPALELVAAATPGSLLERKSAAIAWHYRNVAEALVEEHARLLRTRLAPAVLSHEIELVEGRKVIEVRPRGVNKGIVARHLPAGTDTAVLAIGDDRTDDDLFEALPPSSVKIAVGVERRRSDYVLPDYRAVRELLRALVR